MSREVEKIANSLGFYAFGIKKDIDEMTDLFMQKDAEIERLQSERGAAIADMSRLAGMALEAYKAGVCASGDVCGLCKNAETCDRAPTDENCFVWSGMEVEGDE